MHKDSLVPTIFEHLYLKKKQFHLRPGLSQLGKREQGVDDLNRPLITGSLEYLIQPDVTVTRQREREFSDVWEMFKAAFGRCQESETQRTHLDWIFLALAAAYIEPSQISTFSGNFVIYGIFVFIVKDRRHLTERWRERGVTGGNDTGFYPASSWAHTSYIQAHRNPQGDVKELLKKIWQNMIGLLNLTGNKFNLNGKCLHLTSL